DDLQLDDPGPAPLQPFQYNSLVVMRMKEAQWELKPNGKHAMFSHLLRLNIGEQEKIPGMEEVTQQPHCSHHEMPAVAAGERRGEEVLEGASKKKFWKLPSFLKRAKKQSSRDEAEEQEQEQVPSWPHSNSEDDIMDHYELIKPLGAGGFGVVFEATRVADGLKVALKEVMKTKDLEYITIGPRTPGIIKLLEWQEQDLVFVMVLEYPSPCENLASFLDSHNVELPGKVVRHIMRQAAQAVETCWERQVFHGDIKLENFLFYQETLEVKLIDFGCGAVMREEAFTTLYGTMEYYPPEYSTEGRYHGEPAMVWALGVVMFALLCGRLPDLQDLVRTAENVWTSQGLSKKCCKLVCSLLQPDPERRMKLGEILGHAWFKRFWKLLAFLKRKKHSPQEQAEEEEQEQVPVPPAPPSNSQDCNQEEDQRPTADAGEEASSTELQEASNVCRALSFLLRPLQSLIDQFDGLEELEPQPVGEEEEEGEEDEIEEAEEAVEEGEEGFIPSLGSGPDPDQVINLLGEGAQHGVQDLSR
ncbi:hypothetical protein DNTS_001764, partial [Danionella cerebrum]